MRGLIPGVAVLLLSSCSTARLKMPATPARPTVSATFREAPAVTANAGDASEFWKNYEDPVLAELIGKVTANNLEVRIAAERVLEARARIGEVRSRFLPAVSTGANTQRLRGGFNQGIIRILNPPGGGPPGGGGSLVSPFETGIFAGSADMRWELDLFGGIRAQNLASKAELAASEESRRDALVLVTAEASRLYMELRGLEERIRIAERTVANQRELLELIAIRAKAGLSPQLDEERQKALVAEQEASIPPLRAARIEVANTLQLLAGLQPGGLETLLAAQAAMPRVPQVDAGVPSGMLTRRPDIRRADAEIQVAAARIGVARSDYFPKLTLTGQMGRQATSVPGLSLGGGNFFGVGPGVQLPLFTGGRVKANVQAEEARWRQATLAYEKEVLEALAEADTAIAHLREEESRAEHLTAAIRSNRDTIAMTRELYTKGLGDFLSVLEAERQLYATEDQFVVSNTRRLQRSVDLYKALGGGWKQ
ncbi:MAG: TolC family protein [Bryobacterales bacterium]|nr:TolC family protein [Bryobacterales bacterium]